MLFCFLFVNSLHSQNFKQLIGLRLGGGTGFTFKQQLKKNNTFEIIGAFNLGNYENHKNGVYIAGLYQFTYPIVDDVEGLHWFWGVGADLSVTEYKNNTLNTYETEMGFGADGMLGIDYTLTKAPLNFSFDWKPSYQFIKSDFWGSDIALSIRYMIK